MFSPEKLASVFAMVEKNNEVLKSCDAPHNFEPCNPDENIPLFKQKCTKCGGLVFQSDAIWYKKGLKDGERQR